MRNLKLQIGVIVTALAVAASAQSPRPVRKTSAVSTSSTSSSSAFAAAATTNVTLRNDLTWMFGGKQQRGWYLYDLLIGKTLNSDADSVTDDFAAKLASWKKKRGLKSDGVLDEPALMALISQWQGARLKSRAAATPDQLITVPPSDFYDPGRAPELRQVERKTYDAYREMIAAAMADPELKLTSKESYLKIISAFRSPEYQEQL